MAGSLQKLFPRVIKRAGIEQRPITAHALRHTFATAMLHTAYESVNGQLVLYSSFQVAQLLGQDDSRLVDGTYGHLQWDAGVSTSLSLDALRRYPSTRAREGELANVGSLDASEIVLT